MKPLDALAESTGRVTSYNERVKTDGFMPKIMIGQRVCKDGPSRLWQHIAGNEVRPKLVYELDDDLWNVDPTNHMAYEWFMNGYDRFANEYHAVHANMEENIRVSDRVTV